MGAFSFSNDFEVIVNFAQTEAYQRLLNYLQQKRLKIIREKEPESLSWRTKMSLISYPMNFDVSFYSIDDSHTKIAVNASSGQLDLGRSKGMFNDIMKKIY